MKRLVEEVSGDGLEKLLGERVILSHVPSPTTAGLSRRTRRRIGMNLDELERRLKELDNEAIYRCEMGDPMISFKPTIVMSICEDALKLLAVVRAAQKILNEQAVCDAIEEKPEAILCTAP